MNSKERLVLASDVAFALETGEIDAHYQPIADAVSRRIIGAEALVRWRRSDGTMVPPLEFVPVAEHAGLSRLLTPVGPRPGAGAAPRMARGRPRPVHVGEHHRGGPPRHRFPNRVSALLAARSIPPHALVLELTEASILSDPMRIGDVLARLSELGIGLALDDFGTGYSSLAHLRTLAVGQVKIDRSFVMGMSEQPADAAIVYATIELAHKLGHDVIAEGVQDDQTWSALTGLGCDRIQGYVLAKPAAAADFQRLLTDAEGDGVTASAPGKHLVDR
jgi:EAL domain-containing protein (putative c-di-GMP-specific phosphodiesterase class I)